MTTAQDYATAIDAYNCVLFADSCQEADSESSINILESLPKGTGRLEVLDMQLGNLAEGEQAWFDWIKFEVTLYLPE